MSAFDKKTQDDLDFMTRSYGFSREDLQGIDIARLIDDYQLRTRDYTPEEVRRILAEEGDVYVDDGTTALFSIFSADCRALGQEEAEIVRIGFYVNSGTTEHRIVCDLKSGVFYADDSTAHALTAAQTAQLARLPEKWGVPQWELHTEGEEQPSTGSYGWKLAFELADGGLSAYDGYTGDMSHLPEHFEELRDELIGILEASLD